MSVEMGLHFGLPRRIQDLIGEGMQILSHERAAWRYWMLRS
jgi:hypothetical protein